ncbi:leucine-rich repeat domain-containing protein [Psychroserpens sp.]
MKYYSILLLFVVFQLQAQNTTYIPDDNFEQALINLGYDSGPLDDYVLTSNINSITTLDISFNNIIDLQGIKDFTLLQILRCDSNRLTSLDLTYNANLLSLQCQYNQLLTLDLSNNITLFDLVCNNNNLVSINVSNCTWLQVMQIENNQFTSIDVSNNQNLQVLWCSNNQISNLNLSINLQLTNLNCNNNLLTGLNLTSNTGIQELDCSYNQITNIAFSNNLQAGGIVKCNNNLISILDLSNSYYHQLNCSNNNLVALNFKNGWNNTFSANLNATSNPDLNCIIVDNVNAPYMSTWQKDVTATYYNSMSQCDPAESIIDEKELEDKDISIVKNEYDSSFRVKGIEKPVAILVYNLQGDILYTDNNYSNRWIKVNHQQDHLYIVKISKSDGSSILKKVLL